MSGWNFFRVQEWQLDIVGGNDGRDCILPKIFVWLCQGRHRRPQHKHEFLSRL